MVKRALLSPALAAPLALGWVSTGLAQDLAQDAKAVPDRAQSFEAAQGAVQEDVPGGPLLLAGYAILWVALLAYLFRLVLLQQRAQADLARLERALSQASSSK